MSDLHVCAGIREAGDKVVVCACVSPEMFRQLEDYLRADLIKEIQAFAGDYHHHVEGRDVVIVDQLLAFLQPVKES